MASDPFPTPYDSLASQRDDSVSDHGYSRDTANEDHRGDVILRLQRHERENKANLHSERHVLTSLVILGGGGAQPYHRQIRSSKGIADGLGERWLDRCARLFERRTGNKASEVDIFCQSFNLRYSGKKELGSQTEAVLVVHGGTRIESP